MSSRRRGGRGANHDEIISSFSNNALPTVLERLLKIATKDTQHRVILPGALSASPGK